MCELEHCRAWAERLLLVCPSSYARVLDADVSIRNVHGTTLLRIDNLDYPLTIPKNWSHQLPCWLHPFDFLWRGWPMVLPLHALFFSLDRSDGPMFHSELRFGR
jgi:hypothetical protein